MKSIGVSVYITVIGTLVNLFFSNDGLFLSQERIVRPESGAESRHLLHAVRWRHDTDLSGRQELHLLDSLWALMPPGAISAFNLIIVKTFPGDSEGDRGGRPHRRLLRAWPLRADRAAAVNARPRYVYVVLRRRALERFLCGTAVY